MPSGPFLVSRTGAVGRTKRRLKVPKWKLIYIPVRKALVAIDSRAVAMEVGIRLGVCNYSPAEATSP